MKRGLNLDAYVTFWRKRDNLVGFSKNEMSDGILDFSFE